MAGLNDLYFGLGTSLIAVSGTGGTLAVGMSPGVIGHWIYPHSGTMHVCGFSQAPSATHGIPVISNTEPIQIHGPAAFVLVSLTNGAEVKIATLWSQSGIPDSSKAT